MLLFLTPKQIFGQYEWSIQQLNTTKNALKPNENCYLIHLKLDKTLAYKKAKKGINLAFVNLKKTPDNIIFKDLNNDGILDTSDLIAIQVLEGAYLKYGAREYGINIVWSQTPVYEWAILSEDKSVSRIQNNKKYAIFNKTKQSFLVYGEREDNIGQLKWFDDW